MTAHTKRLITAVATLPGLLAIIFFAPFWTLLLLIAAATLLSLYEYYAMFGISKTGKHVFINYILTAMMFFSLLYKDSLYVAILPLFIMVPLISIVFDYKKTSTDLGQIALLMAGPFYICMPLVLLAFIATLEQGRFWLLFVLGTIFAGDTCSFYFGKAFGKHKLSSISPSKTWEGSFGGILGNAACGGCLAYFFLPSLPAVPSVLLATLMGVIGQFGDLAESVLKRSSNLKDSGGLLPGHGGMLDRIDSLLFALPVLYLYLCYYEFC